MKANTELAKTAFRYCGGFAALFILFSGKLSAQQTTAEEKLSAEDKPSFQVAYLQEEKDYFVFKISATKTGNKRTSIRVSDEDHETVYFDSFNGDTFIKTLKLPKYGDDRIEFQLISGKDIIRKSFSIKSRLEEVYVVSEL